MKKIIIIPAYNEEASICRTVRELMEKVPEFDYVVINDCSKDDTLRICRENGFNVIDLPVNLGIGGAVQTGYRYAAANGYECAVQVDGDGQHDTAFLRDMARLLEDEDLDMVIGSRFIENQGFRSSRLRRVGIRFFSFLIKIMTGQTITDPTSGLRMVGSRVLLMFADEYPRDYPEPESTLKAIRSGCAVKEIPVVMRERTGGVSSISMKKSVYYMVKVTLAMIFECFRRSDAV